MGLLHVRYDEVGLKGANRPYFEKKLRKNLARQLRIEGGSVRRVRGRIVVDAGDRDPRTVLPDIARCFGVASASPILVVPRIREEGEAARKTEVEGIAAAAIELARDALAKGLRTFKVEGRRVDKKYPITSTVLAGRVGHAVLQAVGVDRLKVSLHEPEFTIGVEVRGEGFAVHALAVPGPGGIPVGIAGRALVLLSGGIDSPVAAWYAMKRGLHADFVYFHSFPYTGDKAKEKVLTLARELSRWAPDPVFGFIPNLAHVQDAIAAAGDEELRIVVLRRFMYRVADRIARLRGHKALVTGEALGQVASQTPENLLCVEVTVPGTLVLRPLVGFDKHEVVAKAKAIGTFETSILPYEDCCSLFAPRHPALRGTPERCQALEAKLDVVALEEQAVAQAEVWRFRSGESPERFEGQGVRKKSVPAPRAEAPAAEDDPEPEELPSERDADPGAVSHDEDVLKTDFSEG